MNATVFPMNLGPRGRRQRRGLGIAMLAVAFLVLVLLVARGDPRTARLAVFVPLWIAGLGLFQSAAGT